ncbi:hypothetical protein Tco_0299498 [Tanacetum coccineum]
MSHLSQLAAYENSIQLTDIMDFLFHNDNQRDCQLVRETYVSCQQLMVHLLIVLECASVFQKKGIDPSKYTITLSHGLLLDVDDPVNVALAYREKMV